MADLVADPAATLSITLLGVVLCALFPLLVLHFRRGVKSGARLPKGTFGWPIIGETFAIARDPLGFAISHQKRYGSIFKSSIFMRKTIVGTTPEFLKFVSLNPDLFQVQYPKNVEFVSPKAILFGDGPRHVALKKLFINFTLPESLQTMIPTLESIMLENLASWEGGTVVCTDAFDELVADTSAYVALGIKHIRSTPEGTLALKNMLIMIESIGGFPINLLGTAHNKGHKARGALRLYLKSIVKQRMSQEDTESDILRIMLEAREKAEGEEVKYFDEGTIIDEMVGAWIGAFKTTATTLVWTLKFLVDYPDVLRRVQAEQQEILKGKDLSVAGPRLTWEDTKKMVYTAKVELISVDLRFRLVLKPPGSLPRPMEENWKLYSINFGVRVPGQFYQEVQRRLSICFLIPRKAAEDVVYHGFLIPKGWAVIPLLSFMHHDPANYEDPMTINPDRFNATPKPNTYLPFGLGVHRCPGEELAKVVFFILVHHVTTTYEYERVGPDRGEAHNGFPVIVGGYPINVRRRT